MFEVFYSRVDNVLVDIALVIGLVVRIKKDVIHFLIQRIVHRVHGKIWPNLPTRGYSAITPMRIT